MVSVDDKEVKKSLETLTEFGVFMYLEFKANNAVVFGLGSDKADLLDTIKKTTPNGKIAWEAKYKLLAGDKVEFYDIDPDAKAFFKKARAADGVTIKLDKTGDEMTMTDTDIVTGKFVRIKEEKKDKPEKK
jgi:hypothetical protein